ncbi:MAG TPA: metallopeptidase family protein [Candidatus Acidoferrales bacterium]|nr:metallopeptidase family protein [Candidatus Acidoferrales bacterium]
MNWKRLCDVASAEVEAVLVNLPVPLREEAKQLSVTLERIPNAELLEEGIEADTLGIFTGAEFAEKGYIPMPSQIILFLENLWDYAEGDENAFREEIRTTFLHELGHYFGLEEEDLFARGLE